MVYVIFNNCPFNFGEKEIIAIHLNKPTAEDALKRLKKKDEYANQYLEIIPFREKW